MTAKERIERNVGEIFKLFRGQEIDTHIAERIEKAIREQGSRIALTDIEDALNYMLKNDYFKADVRGERGPKNKTYFHTDIKFKTRRPRQKKIA